LFFFFQAEDGIRDKLVTGVQTCALPISPGSRRARHPDPQLYERHGVKMVAYDRPGYGESEPHIGRSVADAAPDIEAIANELGFRSEERRVGKEGRSRGWREQ